MNPKKIYSYLRVLRYIHKSIYFNLKYLPFRQAIKLPILLYKPTFGVLKGSISVKCPNSDIKTGMIELGFPANLMYPNNGIFLEIAGEGRIEFRGKTTWGNTCAISVGPKGILTVGKNVLARVSVRCCAYHYVKIGDKTHIGWNTLLMDTSFHTMKDATTHEKLSAKPYAPIILGDSNWVGSNCTILKGTRTEAYTTFAAGTIISKNLHAPECSIIGGSPAKVLKEGVYRDMDDSDVQYEWHKE